MSKIVLVTGASSGIGKATAIELKGKGFIVYGAARRIEKLKELEDYGIKTIVLDVTDDASMVSCVNTIFKIEGNIDILINNAGYGSYGAIEDVPIEEARRQIEVNVFGLARMTQLVLPKMREKKYGKIVNISSMGGRVWSSFGGWYHTTKFAVEGFTNCLRVETKPFGIDAIVIEPGGIKTEWGTIAAENLRKSSANGAYSEQASIAAERMKKTYAGKRVSDPELIAKTIYKAVTANKPKTRYLVGYGAKPAVFLKNLLGDKIFDKISIKMM